MSRKNGLFWLNTDRLIICLGFRFLLAIATGVSAAQNPAPMINQPLVPDAIKPGGSAFTLTVNGSGFVADSVVNWNGRARTTTFVSKSRLTASIPSTDIAKAGTAALTVVNPAPGGGRSNVAFLEISYSSTPLVLGAISNFGNGNTTVFVAPADFNHDGKEDLAVADVNNNDLMVMLGNGDGTFQSAVHYALGASPNSIAVGDFNGDGNLDLAVSDGNISILLGNGDGTFLPAATISDGGGTGAIAVGDFNGDGKLDLAAADGSAVSILLGNGDGTFNTPVSYALATGAQALAIGDFNGDGKLDLALALGNFDGTGTETAILLGNGDGTFEPAANYPTGRGPFGITVGDFNHDGHLDVVTANAYVDTVSVLLGNGDGTFKSHVDYATGGSSGSFPVAITSADFNANGNLDLIVANLYGENISVLLGNGDGTFQPAQTYPLATGNNTDSPNSVGVADFNGDGRLDVAVPTYASGQAGILLQVPTIILSKSSLHFVNQVLGTASASQTVTLTNTSALTAQVSSIAITGANATDFSQTHTCGSTLSVGASCTITVVFKPTEVGPRTAFVTITDNAAASPQQIALSGTGVVSGQNATLSPATLTFGTQLLGTTSAAQIVTLSNYGTSALSIGGVATAGDFNDTTICGSSLAAGASCTISVTFKPTQINGRTGELSVTDKASGSPQKVSLSGEGTIVKTVPASLAFYCHISPNTCPPPAQTTTVTNTANTSISIDSISASGQYFSQTNNCPAKLAAGSSCTITVNFTSKKFGTFSGTVSVSDSGGASPQQISLSGRVTKRGTSPAVRSALGANTIALVPNPNGQHQVGTHVMSLLDTSRNDRFLANGTKRELLVRFWYPASIEADCQPADYASPSVWSYFSELLKLRLPAVQTNSCLNAPVLDAAHPVVVFTHGYTGTFTDYTFLLEDLASRGYVVASIDHTYEATAEQFPDGRFAKSMVGSHLADTWRIDDQTLSFALSVRVGDVKFVLNELGRLNTSAGNPFSGKLDLTKVALAGHSLGGLTTWLGVQQDARFKAGILVDPYLAQVSSDSTETPVMLLTMGHEQRNEDECRLWNDLRGPRLAVNLRGAEHVTVSDAVWLAKGAVKTGSMGPEKTIAAMRDYIAAFLDTNLRGNPTGRLLTGPSREYPDADVTTQEPPLCRQP